MQTDPQEWSFYSGKGSQQGDSVERSPKTESVETQASLEGLLGAGGWAGLQEGSLRSARLQERPADSRGSLEPADAGPALPCPPALLALPPS